MAGPPTHAPITPPTTDDRDGKPIRHIPGYATLYSESGVDTAHIDRSFLANLDSFARNQGVFEVDIFSGYRTPAQSEESGGYSNDPHTRGVAVDAYARKAYWVSDDPADGRLTFGNWMPLATIASPFDFLKAKLQSGNTPTFFNGQPDLTHVQVPNSGDDKSIHAASTGTPSQPAPAATKASAFWGLVLDAIGAKPTSENLSYLSAWARREGTAALNNPLATTLRTSDSYGLSGNPAGVQQYPTAQGGASATAATLRGGYPAILAALRSGDPYGYQQSHAPEVASDLTKWSGSGYTSVARGDDNSGHWYSGITSAAGDAAGTVNDAARHIPGVAQAEGVAGGAISAVTSLDDAVKFIFSIRFLEIIGGMGLIAIGVLSLAKDSTVVQTATSVASRGATGVSGTAAASREAGRRPTPRRPSMPVREPTAGTAYDRVQPATGDPIPY